MYLIILIVISGLIIASGIYFSNFLLHYKIPQINSNNNNSSPSGLLPKNYYNMISSWFDEVRKKSFHINSKYGYKIVGYFIPSQCETNKTVIISHGVGASKNSSRKYAKLFYELGFNTVIYDHRFHGESGGKNISYGHYERYDLQKIVHYAKDKTGEDAVIGIHGESMGAGILLMYGSTVEDGADFYIANCPYSNFYEECVYRLANDFSFVPKFLHGGLTSFVDIFVKLRGGYSLKTVCPIDHIVNIKNPILFINTKEDKYIPITMTEQLYTAKPDKKYIYWVEKGKHAAAYDQDPNKYKSEVENFLKEINVL